MLQSIYKQTMDTKIESLIEAGLTKHYFDKEMDKIARIANSKVSSVKVIPLSLLHLSGPFMAWAFMLLISTLVFLHELVTNFREKVLNARRNNTTTEIGKIDNDKTKIIGPLKKSPIVNGTVRPKFRNVYLE